MRPAAAASGLALSLWLAGCAPGLSGPVPLRLVEWQSLEADPAEAVQELLLVDAGGDSIRAVLRRPILGRLPPEGLPAVVLVAGRETGRDAAAVIPGPLRTIVLAVEYPEVIPQTAAPGEVLSRLPTVRRSAYRMPGLLRGAARYLARMPEVDSARIGLVGVSFGVPFAAAAGTDAIFCCVALHHGGAGLGRLFRTNLSIRNSLLRAVAAGWAARYFAALEPARHVGRISPRPLLLINGSHDTMVPREAAARLARAAREPVRQIWLPHDHLMPDDFAVMRELADSTLRHFPQLSGGAPD